MSCHRAYEIDLEDLLAEPGSPALAEFEAHAAGCPDCAQALSLERSLTAHLRGETPGGLEWHPSDGQLLQYRSARERLDAGVEERIRTHFSACAPCRDAFHAFSALAHAPVVAESPSLLARMVEGVRSLVRSPATASALADALLAVFGLFLVVGEPEDPAADWTRGREPLSLPALDPEPDPEVFSLRLGEDAGAVLTARAVPAGQWLELHLLVPPTLAGEEPVFVRATPVAGAGRPFEGEGLLVGGPHPYVRVRLASEWLERGVYEISLHERDPGDPAAHRYSLEVR